jgi:hypothetical protein
MRVDEALGAALELAAGLIVFFRAAMVSSYTPFLNEAR